MSSAERSFVFHFETLYALWKETYVHHSRRKKEKVPTTAGCEHNTKKKKTTPCPDSTPFHLPTRLLWAISLQIRMMRILHESHALTGLLLYSSPPPISDACARHQSTQLMTPLLRSSPIFCLSVDGIDVIFFRVSDFLEMQHGHNIYKTIFYIIISINKIHK